MNKFKKICRATLMSFMIFNVVSCSEGGAIMNVDEQSEIVSSMNTSTISEETSKIYELDDFFAECTKHINIKDPEAKNCNNYCDFEFAVGLTIKGQLAKRYYAEPYPDVPWQVGKYYRFSTEKFYINDRQYIWLEFISNERQNIETTDIITLKITGTTRLDDTSGYFTYELINIEK